jgi:hypothetical protein
LDFCAAEICRQQADGQMHSMIYNGSDGRSYAGVTAHSYVKALSTYTENGSTASTPRIHDAVASTDVTEPSATASTSIAESIADFMTVDFDMPDTILLYN